MISLAVITVFNADFSNGLKITINPKLKSLTTFFKHSDFAILIVFFFLIALSGLYSENFQYFSIKQTLRGPLLFLPIVFYVLPKFSKRQYFGLFIFLSFLMLFQSFLIAGKFVFNQEFYISEMGRGKALPTPISHIRYSLLTVICIFSCFYCWKEKVKMKWNWEPTLYLVLAILHLIILHFLAVRSGLLAFYGTTILVLFIYIIQTRNYRNGILVLLFLFLIPVIAFQNFPSLKQKWNYMKYDFEQFRKGNKGTYSDKDRFNSLIIGWELIKENPILGVGAGDVLDEMQNQTTKTFPESQGVIKLPHNQLITTLASGGAIGLFLFLLAFLLPVFYKGNYRHPFILIITAVIGISFLTEDTFENSIGVAIYAFFLCVSLNYKKEKM